MSRVTMLLACSLLVASSASAQQRDQTPRDTASRAMPSPHRGGDRAMMMKMMEASDARLDQLVQAMNSATGQKKVDAMAAVINELITQRKQMRGHMRQMMHPPGSAPQ